LCVDKESVVIACVNVEGSTHEHNDILSMLLLWCLSFLKNSMLGRTLCHFHEVLDLRLRISKRLVQIGIIHVPLRNACSLESIGGCKDIECLVSGLALLFSGNSAHLDIG